MVQNLHEKIGQRRSARQKKEVILSASMKVIAKAEGDRKQTF